MKKIILFICCIAAVNAHAQTEKPAFDGHKWQAPYSLDFPKGWDVERFLIPIEFAPSIPYKGVEDIRFTPGWGNAKTEEYWSYAFLWFLEEKPVITKSTIEENLKKYYTGLIGLNIVPRKIPVEKNFPVQATVNETKAEAGDAKTFNGKIYMLDYMEQKPITLHCIIHVKYCAGKNNSFVFTEISPQEFTHSVWQNLHQLWKTFSCDKTLEKK